MQWLFYFENRHRLSLNLVPRRGLEPPRCYSLVPETSASTNSATWAFQERFRLYIKKNTPGAAPAHLSDEIEGSIQGHRDGHGFVIRDDGEGDIYIPPNEMRAVLHKDRVRVRIVRQDRRGRPEGRAREPIIDPALSHLKFAESPPYRIHASNRHEIAEPRGTA